MQKYYNFTYKAVRPAAFKCLHFPDILINICILRYNTDMYEIELKAHVYDKAALTEKLNSFAEYRGNVSKYDSYWKQEAFILPIRPAEQKCKNTTVRIRIEKSDTEKNPLRTLVTCKRKQRIAGSGTDSGKSPLEVNEEHEFTVSDAAAFENLIINAGFSPFLTKSKECTQWVYEDILIELCAVDGLGDFLEAEILRETDSDTDAARIKLEKLFEKCEIPLEQIEPMYYSELLAIKNKKS